MTAAKLRPNALLSLHRRNHVKNSLHGEPIYGDSCLSWVSGVHLLNGVKRAVGVSMVKLYIGPYKV